MTTPALSILLPVYNNRPYLGEAIASIQQQTVTDFELLVIDDGSTDGSAAIAAAAAQRDPRVRLIRQSNSGIVGALNRGLEEARGELIGRMDGDDVAEPERLQRQLAYLAEHPECVIVGTGAWFMDPGGAVVDRVISPASEEEIESRLLQGDGSALIHASVIMRGAAVRAVGGYLREFDKAEDIDLFFRLMTVGRLANLVEPLMRIRLHPRSTCFSQRPAQRELIRAILARESSQRGLSDEAAEATGHTDISRSALHRQWACTSLVHGRRRTALRHALIALLRAPHERATWGTLRYVIAQAFRR